MKISENMRLYALDSMKFLALVAMYFHHLNYIPSFGTLSVTFFFVVSGFVIAFSYGQKKIDYREYLYYRLLRTYPVYILTFIASFPLMLMTHFGTDLKYTLANVLMLQSYFPIGVQVFAYNGVAWFVADLMLFWALTPFILAMLNRAVNKKAVLVFLGAILFTIGVSISYLFRDNMAPYSLGWWLIYISPYFRIIDYIIGLLTGLIFINVPKDVLRDKTMFSIFELSAIGLLLASYLSSFFGYISLKYDLYYVPAIVLLIFIFAFQGGIFSSILSFRLFAHLGEISYPIFMTHQILITYVAQLFVFNIYNNYDNPKKLFAQIFLYFLIVCISDVINRHIEMPLMKSSKARAPKQ